jgi:ABC-2 type transport system permease protein
VRPWLIALPFRAVNGFPCEVLSGLTSGRDLLNGFALQVGWLVVLAFASRRVWLAGVRRYVAVGG